MKLMEADFLRVEKNNDAIRLVASGEWTVHTAASIEPLIESLPGCKDDAVLDVGGITRFDSAGAALWHRIVERCGNDVRFEGMDDAKRRMYALLERSGNVPLGSRPRSLLYRIGKATVSTLRDAYDFVAFLGHVTTTFGYLLFHPMRFRYKETIYHIYQSGVTALLIVGLTAFLVGMVVAYQGAVQLAKFGADIFIVDTVGISMVRELGPMITAIVIAGRSGSSYTAEIGAMKITEEIAAMRTMGFDPFVFLVMPRITALIVALPLLVFFADAIGIFGGMVASRMELGLSFEQFSDRLAQVVDVKHYILGIVKAPVFAFVIASIGCFRGFQVSDTTESIGLQTTASVVNAIFLVIAFDALFSVIYTEFGW